MANDLAKITSMRCCLYALRTAIAAVGTIASSEIAEAA
jgi:hypothetical protein